MPFAEFPSITICNFNRAHRERAIKVALMVNETGHLDPDLLSYLYLSFTSDYETALLEHEFLRDVDEGFAMLNRMKFKFEAWKKRIGISDMSTIDIVKFLGYKCEELLSLCRWKGMPFDCCDEEFITPNITKYGLCYSISPRREVGDTIAKQTIPGTLYFNIEVNIFKWLQYLQGVMQMLFTAT